MAYWHRQWEEVYPQEWFHNRRYFNEWLPRYYGRNAKSTLRRAKSGKLLGRIYGWKDCWFPLKTSGQKRRKVKVELAGIVQRQGHCLPSS